MLAKDGSEKTKVRPSCCSVGETRMSLKTRSTLNTRRRRPRVDLLKAAAMTEPTMMAKSKTFHADSKYWCGPRPKI